MAAKRVLSDTDRKRIEAYRKFLQRKIKLAQTGHAKALRLVDQIAGNLGKVATRTLEEQSAELQRELKVWTKEAAKIDRLLSA